ncbi:MAG: hypothetical protein HOC20_06200 [Chloroflexi bacterium]|jgi:type I restriction enzyme, S subunit|nr:hypothetical protein [Chloroflexota bacterium]
MTGLADIQLEEMADKWRVTPLKDQVKLTNGSTFKASDWKTSGIPIIRIQNLKDSTAPFNYFEGDPTSEVPIEEGDLLFSWSGSKGTSFGPHMWHGPLGVLNQHIFKVIPKNDADVDRFFLYFALKYLTVRIEEKACGLAALVHVRKGDLESTPIPFPPLPEQKKIAYVLSTVQRAIEQQERIIALTTELKKSLMHKLFTEGTRDEPQKQTEIGLVPESWAVVPLGEMFQIKHGFAFDGNFFELKGDFILMTPGHFNEEDGFRNQEEKTKYYTGSIPETFILREGDLLVAMTEQKAGLLGSSAFVPEPNRYLHNQRLGLIEKLNTARLQKRFLYHVFNTPRVRIDIAKTATGSKVKHTSPGKIQAVCIGLPDIDEQIQIAEALDTLERKVALHHQKRLVLSNLFKSLLHQLMTAQIRVANLDLATDISHTEPKEAVPV